MQDAKWNLERDGMNIALAADEAYALPLSVAIYSLLKNTQYPEMIRLHILVNEDFPKNRIEEILGITRRFGAPEPSFYPLDNIYPDATLTIPHTSRATYYRLSLPNLLCDADYCLYLDSDILVCGDVLDIFSARILGEDWYVAWVTSPSYCEPAKNERHRKTIGVSSLQGYPNAGVILMNLAMMRKDQIQDRFMELLDERLPMQDQDVIYKACQGPMRSLPPRCNALNAYELSPSEYLRPGSCLPLAYSREEWREACESPVVIHFARKEKPWIDYSLGMASLWWEYAFEAGLGKECFFRYFDNASVVWKRLREVMLDNVRLEKRIASLQEKNEALVGMTQPGSAEAAAAKRPSMLRYLKRVVRK